MGYHIPADVGGVNAIDTHEECLNVGGEEVAAGGEGIDCGGSGEFEGLAVEFRVGDDVAVDEVVIDFGVRRRCGDGDNRLAGLTSDGEDGFGGLGLDHHLFLCHHTRCVAIADTEGLHRGRLSKGEGLGIDRALCGGVCAVEGVVNPVAVIGTDGHRGGAVLVCDGDDRLCHRLHLLFGGHHGLQGLGYQLRDDILVGIGHVFDGDRQQHVSVALLVVDMDGCHLSGSGHDFVLREIVAQFYTGDSSCLKQFETFCHVHSLESGIVGNEDVEHIGLCRDGLTQSERLIDEGIEVESRYEAEDLRQ